MDSYSENNIEFIQRYIQPFYSDLMNLNFIRKPTAYTDELFALLNDRAHEIENEDVIKMLNDSWRPSKVGAWMISISKPELKDELKKYLTIPGKHYSEHILFNVLLLEERNAAEAIKSYILLYMNSFINGKISNIDIERVSLQWAISIIRYIDHIFKTNHENDIKSSPTWGLFTLKMYDIPYGKEILANIKSDHYINTIQEAMRRLKEWYSTR